ncbi:lysozyme inhibitor LprI family protein [Mesorhizobium neociceri]|uniref:DUF1311 domain-containing protein n=1 Tax=Mesorhizobium neociceri TaxID=1307853 RepID=A0A838B9W2_9HYPH|nr:lysozyme inhibitor LprI family protein [Mesorhizobium neociceri]MBA1142160.1 DUF1311 domain-containing protein [Mesorhizobium neociceri]
MGAVLTVLLAASDHAAAQGKPSFDCAKAASVAEKAICADPTLAQADAEVAKNYAALLKTLDAPAGKALRDDQSDFIAYRDQIAGFNENTPKDQQTFDLGEFLHGRAAFLAGIRKPADAGFIGTWSSVRGSVEIKAAGTLASSRFRRRSSPILSREAVRATLVARSRSARPCGWSTPTTTTNRPGSSSPFAAMVMRSPSSRTAPVRTTDRSRHHAAPNGHADGTFFLTQKNSRLVVGEPRPRPSLVRRRRLWSLP